MSHKKRTLFEDGFEEPHQTTVIHNERRLSASAYDLKQNLFLREGRPVDLFEIALDNPIQLVVPARVDEGHGNFLVDIIQLPQDFR